MGQRYFLNGQVAWGWRIEDRGSSTPDSVVATVAKREVAELIIELLNKNDETEKQRKAWDAAHEAAE